MTNEPKSPLRISVVVPVFNDEDGLRRCLEALNRQSLPKPCFEVIVVDNGSEMPPLCIVQPYAFARLIIEPAPGSYSARNAGAREASGDLLAFTDADCRPVPDWLERGVAEFDTNPEVNAIGGRVVMEFSAQRRVAELYESVLPPIPQDRLVAMEGFAATANLLVRRSVFRAVGPFNPLMRSSGDREWCRRLVSKGYAIRYSAECVVLHSARRTVRDLVRRRRRIAGGVLTLSSLEAASGERSQTFRPYPPRKNIAAVLLLRPSTSGLTRTEGLRVFLVAAFLVAVRIVERLRLRVGGGAVR